MHYITPSAWWYEIKYNIEQIIPAIGVIHEPHNMPNRRVKIGQQLLNKAQLVN